MTDGYHHGPIFKAEDGSLWVWNRFRSDLQRLQEPRSGDLAGGGPGAQIGRDNREAVRAYVLAHVGVTNRECAAALGLSVMAVGRHIKTLRQEWLS